LAKLVVMLVEVNIFGRHLERSERSGIVNKDELRQICFDKVGGDARQGDIFGRHLERSERSGIVNKDELRTDLLWQSWW
jgi:hypothetical protein